MSYEPPHGKTNNLQIRKQSRVASVREKSLENDFQVREKSGNLGFSQGICKKCRKSGKSQGISKFSQK